MQPQKFMLLLFPLLGFTACGTGRSSEVKQSTIEQSYSVTYNEATAQLKASASFHYENTLGTSLKLTDGSTITFNGSPMTYSNLLDSASYNLEMSLLQPSVGPFEFRYVNNDGEVFVTHSRIPAPTLIKLPHHGEQLPADRELSVLMQGDMLMSGEEITLCLKYDVDAASSTDPSIEECLHSRGPLSLVFSREQLARFPRNQELSLSLRREAHPKQDNARIHLHEIFLSRPVTITLH